jgi:hypothetical protein
MVYFKKVFLTFFMVLFFKQAYAEISLSGYQEFFAGSADQSIANGHTDFGYDFGGLSNGQYTRIGADYSTTLDSGLELAGVMTIHSRDCMGDRTDNCGVVNYNNVVVSGGFGSIGIGEHFGVGATMFSRLTAGGPTAEPDGAIIGNFYTADTSANYGAGNETAYASNVMKLTYFSNSYSGFSVGVGYTPNTVAEQDDAQATTITNGVAESFSDMLSVVGKYTAEIDGVGIDLAYGMLTGNSGQVAAVNYNDLDETVYSVAISYAGLTVDYRKNEAGNSGTAKNGNAGNNQGSSYCGVYRFDKFGIGACNVETSMTDANNLDNNSKTRTYAADYSLGGGVTVGAVYFTVEQSANNTIMTDVDGVMTMMSIGF